MVGDFLREVLSRWREPLEGDGNGDDEYDYNLVDIMLSTFK